LQLRVGLRPGRVTADGQKMKRLQCYLRQNALACVALFIALGGVSYAAALPRNSVGSKQIKNDAVTSAKVKNGSLKALDFGTGQLPSGAIGAKGDPGPTGPAGPATGAAGGALSGSYPNPALAAGAVETSALADGAVTAAKQAAVPNVRIYQSTTQAAIASVGNYTLVPFDGESYDPFGMHAAASPTQVTIPRTGVYHVVAQVEWPTNNATAFGLDIVRDHDLNDVVGWSLDPALRSIGNIQQVVAEARFTAGQTVDFGVSHDATTSLTLNATSSRTFMAVHWVSP
jgi:hypothetical protein